MSFASSLCLFSGGWWTHGARPWRLIDWRRWGLFEETFGCNMIGVILASLLFQSSWRFLWTYLGQGHRRIRPTNILDNECETIATPPRYLPAPAMWGPSKLPVLQHTAFWHLALLNPCNLVQSQQVCIILASAYQSCMICRHGHQEKIIMSIKKNYYEHQKQILSASFFFYFCMRKYRKNENTKKRDPKKRRNEETKQPRREETKKRSSQETKKQSSQDTKKRRRRNEAVKTTKKRRNEETKQPRHEETKERRHEEMKQPRHEETKKRSSQDTKKPRHEESKTQRHEETKHPTIHIYSI